MLPCCSLARRIIFLLAVGLQVGGSLKLVADSPPADPGLEIYPTTQTRAASRPAHPKKKPVPISSPAAPAPSTPSTNIPPPSTQPSDLPAEYDTEFNTVMVLDRSLQADLSILRVNTDRTETNLLTVYIGLKNNLRHSLNLEILTVYKNRIGIILNPDAASWIPWTLKSRESSEYRSAALTQTAEDYVVKIRLAKSEVDLNNSPGAVANRAKKNHGVLP